MFNLLIEEINEKSNNKNQNSENNDTIIELTKKNLENENRIKHLEEKIKILEDEVNKIKEFHDNKKVNAKNNENELLEKLPEKEENELTQKNMNYLCEQSKEFNSLRKYIFEEKNKHLIIVSEGNQGNNILKYFLDKTSIKYQELIHSQFDEDVKNEEKYYEEVLDNIKNIMKDDNILILKDFDKSLYDIFTQKFTMIDNKKFLEGTFKSKKIFSEVHNNFKVIFIENNIEKSELFKDKFEKQILNFKMFLEEKDLNIVNDIMNYLDLISSFKTLNNIKIDLKLSLINSQREDMEGLIFKLKNDIKIKNHNNKDHWIFKEGKDYENNILKLIFDKIVPLFCQEIITSIILFSRDNKEIKYEKMKMLILEIYKKCRYNNYESFFSKVTSNSIYTFSKENENLFKGIKIKENKFGKFDEKSILFLPIDSIKKENNLISYLKSFLNSKIKNMLVITFSEKELKNIYSVYFIVENLGKEFPSLKEKMILFIIEKERTIKRNDIKIGIASDSISLLDEKYCQVFIDNLKGKDNSKILKIIENNNNDWFRDYLISTNFIEENIHLILSYLKYTIVLETKEINNNNFIEQISNKIINNDELQRLLIFYLINLGEYKLKHIKNIIQDPYNVYKNEVNTEDLFQIIDNQIINNFNQFLLDKIYRLLSDSILFPFIYNNNIVKKNEYFNNRRTVSI